MTTLTGTIDRRLLINYRADPALVSPLLPPGFTPQLVGGHAIVGICLIELRVRPNWPLAPRFGSISAAHRVAVLDPRGRAAVYVPRRDTSSPLAALAGGRLFPGIQKWARISTAECAGQITACLDSRDRRVQISVVAEPTDRLSRRSVFGHHAAASSFFERATIGYSDTAQPGVLDQVRLETPEWSTTPLRLERVESSYFDDAGRFPRGSIALDHGLLMVDIEHSWHPGPQHRLPR